MGQSRPMARLRSMQKVAPAPRNTCPDETRQEALSTATTSRPSSRVRQEPAHASRVGPAHSSSRSNDKHNPEMGVFAANQELNGDLATGIPVPYPANP